MIRAYVIHKIRLCQRTYNYVRQLKVIQFCTGFLVGTLCLSPAIAITLAVALIGINRKLIWLTFYIGLLVGSLRVEHMYGPVREAEISQFFDTAIQTQVRVLAVKEVNDISQEVVTAADGLPAYILVKLPRYPELSIGDAFELNSVLREPTRAEGFNYKEFLRIQGIGYIVGSKALTLINNTSETILQMLIADVSETLPRLLVPPEGELLKGLLIGNPNFNEEFEIMLRSSGTSHIVSVSGYNISMLVSLMLAMSGLVSRRKLYYICSLVIGLYLLLVGVDNLPALRAVLMGQAVLVGLLIGRPNATYLSLLYAVVLMTWLNPLIRLDVSFQLSLGAMLALLLLVKPIQSVVSWMPNMLQETVSTTIAVTLTTLPVSITAFGTTSAVALIANTFILPLIPFTMSFSVLSLAVKAITPIVGDLLLIPLFYLLHAIVSSVRFFGQIPGAVISNSQALMLFLFVLWAGYLILDINYFKHTRR